MKILSEQGIITAENSLNLSYRLSSATSSAFSSASFFSISASSSSSSPSSSSFFFVSGSSSELLSSSPELKLKTKKRGHFIDWVSKLQEQVCYFLWMFSAASLQTALAKSLPDLLIARFGFLLQFPGQVSPQLGPPAQQQPGDKTMGQRTNAWISQSLPASFAVFWVSSNLYWHSMIHSWKWERLPEFFAAQDLDVATTLLNLVACGRVRLQLWVVKCNLKEEHMSVRGEQSQSRKSSSSSDRSSSSLTEPLCFLAWLSCGDQETTDFNEKVIVQDKHNFPEPMTCCKEISPHWHWPGSPRRYQLWGRPSLWNCGKVSDLRLCIPPPGTKVRLWSVRNSVLE